MVSAAQVAYLLVHPNQLRSIIQWRVWHEPVHTRKPESESPTLRRCFYWLQQTSRSFSTVIQELNPELLVPVALYYLILRALDTIEDDMTIPLEVKEPMLRSFADILDQDGWTFDGSGPKEKDRGLLVEFDNVIAEFKRMKPAYRTIITERTRATGNGMADYAINTEHNVNGVDTLKDFDLYCHYVAGLVGHGLTDLFVESGLASPALLEQPHLANSMGLFLQKTNIIRDVREDFDDKKRWYPKAIWSKHVQEFEELVQDDHLNQALDCSSEMVLNALKHVEDCITYMSAIRDQSVFNFVAIPQSMAIATLEKCFRNPRLFNKNVKISKGDACQLMIESSQNLRTVCEVFRRYSRKIHKRNSPKDPNFAEINIRCGQIEQHIESMFPTQTPGTAGKRLEVVSTLEGDTTYLVLTVICSLLVISALIVGIAYLAGARFNIPITGSSVFPSFGSRVEAIVQKQQHGEL